MVEAFSLAQTAESSLKLSSLTPETRQPKPTNMNCTPDKQTFLEKSKHGNLIPVWRELLSDQDTPVSAYERLREAMRKKNPKAHTFLLESVEGGERIARYSFVGGAPQCVFRATGRRVEIETVAGGGDAGSGAKAGVNAPGYNIATSSPCALRSG